MEKKDEIRIPWGTGIVGYVAESGEPVNIPDAYQVNVQTNFKPRKKMVMVKKLGTMIGLCGYMILDGRSNQPNWTIFENLLRGLRTILELFEISGKSNEKFWKTVGMRKTVFSKATRKPLKYLNYFEELFENVVETLGKPAFGNSLKVLGKNIEKL